MKYYYERNTNYNEKVGERTIPVCELYEGEYIVHISESGKFFISQGMWANDIEEKVMLTGAVYKFEIIYIRVQKNKTNQLKFK